MHNWVERFIADCSASKVGRFVFVAYVVYLVSMIGYTYDHIPSMTYPFRFFGERELFLFMNAPQLALIRSTRLIAHWPASKFTDAVLAVYIAMPWWVYGYLFERLVKRIADTSSREASPEEWIHVLDWKDPNRVGPLRKVWLDLGCGPRNAEMHNAESRRM